MNDSSNNRTVKNGPSDDQLDGLLREFFTLETPSALKQPFRRPTLVTVSTEAPVVAPRNRRVIVATTIAVLAMTVVVALNLSGQSSTTGTASNQPVAAPPAESSDDLMLVSPNGDSKSSQAVGADGVTLEETDSIELQPKK